MRGRRHARARGARLVSVGGTKRFALTRQDERAPQERVDELALLDLLLASPLLEPELELARDHLGKVAEDLAILLGEVGRRAGHGVDETQGARRKRCREVGSGAG